MSKAIPEPELVLRVEADASGFSVRGSMQGLEVTFLRHLGDAETARALAMELREGYRHFWKQEWAEARPLLERPALAGCPDAQCAMGNFFHLAMGTEVDGARAVDWYRKAAAQSHALACHCLGTLYATGCGAIAPDPLESARWLAEARRLGLDLYGPGGPQAS